MATERPTADKLRGMFIGRRTWGEKIADFAFEAMMPIGITLVLVVWACAGAFAVCLTYSVCKWLLS